MSKTNIKSRTHEGAQAVRITPLQELRRTVSACLLWEDNFYESGTNIADRISELSAKVSLSDLAMLAITTRNSMRLRHVPLQLCVEMARRGGSSVISIAIETVIQRADELAEFLALYWKNGKVPISKQVKQGLASAFCKFDEYQLAKYNRDGSVKLRDVLFMVHAKPRDKLQAEVWKRLIDGKLTPPDTWEVALSSGANKRDTFTRLLTEGKLGYLALLRNLRNMVDAGVPEELIKTAILERKNGADKVLPFRFVAAARACPRLEAALDNALCAAIEQLPLLTGITVVLVDVSGSMRDRLSSRSDMKRMDAAAALASVINAESLRVFTFSNNLVEVPPRRGMAGVDAIVKSQQHGGTELFKAVASINQKVEYDRLIVITDEQANGRGRSETLQPPTGKSYMINVGVNKNGVGYGPWTHIDGFSENVIRWIVTLENNAS